MAEMNDLFTGEEPKTNRGDQMLTLFGTDDDEVTMDDLRADEDGDDEDFWAKEGFDEDGDDEDLWAKEGFDEDDGDDDLWDAVDGDDDDYDLEDDENMTFGSGLDYDTDEEE